MLCTFKVVLVLFLQTHFDGICLLISPIFFTHIWQALRGNDLRNFSAIRLFYAAHVYFCARKIEPFVTSRDLPASGHSGKALWYVNQEAIWTRHIRPTATQLRLSEGALGPS